MRKSIVRPLLLVAALISLKSSLALGQCYSGQSRVWGVGGCRSGPANLIQAAGYYNLSTSQAAINYETARSMELDNQLKHTETFFEMRRVNTVARKSEEIPGLTTEDSCRIAQANLPKRLTALELNPLTGNIDWPMALQDPRYDNYRTQIDRFFVLRGTSHGRTSYENYMQNQQVIQSFLVDLKSNLDAYSSGDYVTAKNFLKSLEFEAKSPAVSVVGL